MKKTEPLIVEQREYINKEREENKEKERIVKELINEGLISEGEIYKRIMSKRIFFVFTWQHNPPKLVQEKYKQIYKGMSTQPVIDLLGDLGFSRPGPNQNFFVIPEEDLSKKLRSVKSLERFITKRLNEIYNNINKNLAKKYDFRNSFIISVSNISDFSVKHILYSSFSPRFKEMLIRKIKPKAIRKEIENKRHKIKQFVSRLSIDLLIRDLQPKTKEKILNKEKFIKKKLGIKFFTDYRKFTRYEIKNTLNKFLNSNQTSDIADIIKNGSENYYNVLKEMGIDLEED